MSDPDSKKPENDDSLFRAAVQDVTPLTSDKLMLRPTRKTKIARPPQNHNIHDRLSDDFIPNCDEYLSFMRPGVQHSLFKQLRSAKCPIESYLDCHGLTREGARLGLQQFLQQAQLQQQRVVCVVHGKGYHSEDGRPVLKAMVNKWLQELPDVLAFCSAKPQHGGSGAVYVLLRNSRAKEKENANERQ